MAATVAVLAVAIVASGGVAAGLIAAAPAMLALDVATVANVLTKVIISKQPLDAFDIVTIGLVGVANAGVIAKGLKSGINNPALRDFSEQLGKRIGLIGEDTNAVAKIQKELGKIKINPVAGIEKNTEAVLAEPIEATLHRLRRIGLSEEQLKAARQAAIKTRGFTDEFAEELSKSKLIDYVSDVKIDNRLTTAPLAVKRYIGADGKIKVELIVGRGGIDEVKPYMRYAFEHEYSEIVKIQLRNQGRILTENEIAEKISRLTLNQKTQSRLYEVLEENVIADKISLNTRPDLVGEWKISGNIKQLNNNLDLILADTKVNELDLVDLSYAKIFGQYDSFTKFNGMYKLQSEVIKNV